MGRLHRERPVQEKTVFRDRVNRIVALERLRSASGGMGLSVREWASCCHSQPARWGGSLEQDGIDLYAILAPELRALHRHNGSFFTQAVADALIEARTWPTGGAEYSRSLLEVFYRYLRSLGSLPFAAHYIALLVRLVSPSIASEAREGFHASVTALLGPGSSTPATSLTLPDPAPDGDEGRDTIMMATTTATQGLLP